MRKRDREEQLQQQLKRNFIAQRKAAAVLKFEKAITETVHSQLLNRTLDLYLSVQNKLYPDRPQS